MKNMVSTEHTIHNTKFGKDSLEGILGSNANRPAAKARSAKNAATAIKTLRIALIT